MKRVALGTILFIVLIFIVSRVLVGCNNDSTSIDFKEDQNLMKEIIYQINKNSNNIQVSLLKTKQNTIDSIGLEDYVVGVVAAEMPASFEVEALKAQAVAARTYAVAHLEEFGGKSSSGAKGANLTDTTDCQVYVSKEERFKSWPSNKCDEYWEKIVEAVNSTSGQVLTYDGKLVLRPYYFSTSSGNTENAIDVFNVNVSYLRSVKSIGEENSPKYKTENTINTIEFINVINSNFSDANISFSNFDKDIVIEERSEAGTVKKIKLGNITTTGAKVRKAFSLASSNFQLKIEDNNVNITCFGYGHGVGMSQFGANARAKEGKKYIDILKYYYTDTEVGVIQN
ncbi:stage II sporulation protein D [Clostridium sediminicola]|uniref:stage II sporulation protein D n=1 Tax=Clostridium sediminicola TaxID=3114879 RepID=UPI0031F267E6